MKKKEYLKYILLILWMIVIFIMSSFDANDSSSQSNFIVNILANIFRINNLNLLSLIIRKLAHFTEYLVLGLLTYNLFKDKKYSLVISIIFCYVYAVSDEIHQLYVPGRSCQILDILIDTAGSITGIISIN